MEWTEEVSELFCAHSALLRLGARLLVGEGEFSIPAVVLPAAAGGAGGRGRKAGAGEPLRAAPRFLPQPARVEPDDPGRAPMRSERKPEVGLSKRRLKPSRYELAWKVVVPNAVAHDLARHPELAWAIKDDVARALAGAADQAYLVGDPAGEEQPVGIRHLGGVVDRDLGGADLETVVRDVLSRARDGRRADFRYAGWVLRPETLDALTELDQGGRSWDSTRLLVPEGWPEGGLLLGYPFVVSTAGPRDRIHFSCDWSEAWIGAHLSVVRIDVSVDAHFQTDETVIRAVVQHDLVLRRPELFVSAEVP